MANFNGDDGPNIYTGGTEADTAHGRGGDDSLSGNGGNDILAGGSGADTLNGGDDSDYLYSFEQSPSFYASYGTAPAKLPVLDTGTEVDTLNGGGGDDRLFAGYGDHVDGGGPGYAGDYLYISFLGAPTGVTADFGLESQVIGGGTIQGIEYISWVQGSNFADDFNLRSRGVGYSDMTAAYGMGGDDRLLAGYYTGFMDGGEGNDVVDGRPSQYLSLVEGGPGDDVLYTNTNGSATARGGEGNDTIYAGGNVYGGAGNDTIIMSFTYYGGRVFGEAGDDDITAGTSAATIAGGAGADVIRGNSANDVLSAADFQGFGSVPTYDMGLEHDVLSGGGGNDTLAIGYGDDADGGAGNDMLWLSLGGLSGATFDSTGIASGQPFVLGGGTIQNIENLVYLRGSDFADSLTIATQGHLLTIDAGDGDDVVTSNASSVALSGGNGDDHFHSGVAGDTFDGGAGFDTVHYGSAFAGITLVLATPGQTGAGPGGDTLTNVEAAEGSGFADRMTGNGAANHLAGAAGGDTLSGSAGDDTLDGGEGDDFLTGDAGADSLSGGPGTDTADYSQETGGGGILINLSGNPVFASNTLVLQPGQARDSHGHVDTLEGIENFKTGSAQDVVRGSAGANRIETGDGGDFLFGGGGADTLIGGAGDDQYYIYAEDSATFEDIIVELAGGGTDQVRTTLPSFSLAGLPEVEWLLGMSGIDFTLTGNDGNNYLQGNSGADTLEGGLGDDELVGLGGADTMRGGLGDDTYRVEDAGDVVEEKEGEGTDLVWTSLESYSLLGTHIEKLFAFSNIAHILRGNASDNVIVSADSNDRFLLQDGGEDEAVGGGGNDIFYFGTALSAGDVADGGDGRDAIVLQGNVVAVLSETNLVEIESISIQSGANTFFGDTANNLYDYDVTTADGNVAAGQQLIVNAQSLRAGEDLTFDGSAETDGRFLIYGGHGVDLLTGGTGADVFFFEGQRWGPDDKVVGGAGRDSMVISAGSGLNRIEFGADSITGIESISLNNLYASDPSQKPSYELVLHNGNVAPGGTLIVNGNSIPFGQVVNVDGSAVQDGNLILFAGGGHDVLTGGHGADLLFGGGGADALTGGAGADTFRYDSTSDSSGGLHDVIGDFQTGLDRIDLSRIDANTFAAGNQAFSWIGSSAFSGAGAASAGELRLYEQGGYQRIEGDTNGDGIADLLIVLQVGTAPIVQGDFLL